VKLVRPGKLGVVVGGILGVLARNSPCRGVVTSWVGVCRQGERALRSLAKVKARATFCLSPHLLPHSQ
jgi:hypothetical protein